MGKYKKKLRAEKAKVKLKKKTLPKGQNVTNTSFKVKKIVMVEQLKKVKENEPVSNWNVPLKDLLIHLTHHNKSSRINGLNGIKEIITNYPDVLRGPSVKTIIMKILEALTDMEPKIRMVAVSVLDMLFSKLDSIQITPYYEILNIHLACTMTHRHVPIQKDSLRLVDIIIKYAPDAIRQNSKIILINFIRILSSYKYGAHAEIFLTKGSKRDLEENRIAIFLRLTQILKICYPNESTVEKREGLIVNADHPKGFSKRQLTRHFKQLPDLSEIFRQRIGFNKTSFEESESDYKSVVFEVVPLLFDTWAEFSPQCDKSGFIEECIVKERTAKLLGLILGIIIMLYETCLKMSSRGMENLFKSKYGDQFVKLFLSQFPYLPFIPDGNVNSSDIAVNGDETATYSKAYHLQNLKLCYLVYKLRLNIRDDLRKVMDNYVLSALNVRHTKCEDILTRIVEVLISISHKQNKNSYLVLDTVVKAYKQTTNLDFQARLLRILSQVADSGDTLENENGSKCLSELFAYLVRRLCKSRIRFDVLLTLSKIISRRIGRLALAEVEGKFADIIRNLASVQFDGCEDSVGRKCVANILYWCDKSVIEGGLKSGVLDEEGYPEDVREYLKKILTYKLMYA